MNTARTGATVTADYIQSVNRAGVRSTLTSYANTLSTWLRANPAKATLDDVIGGKSIIKTYATLRQASLPYQTAAAITEWTGEIPATYRTYAANSVSGHRQHLHL